MTNLEFRLTNNLNELTQSEIEAVIQAATILSQDQKLETILEIN